MPLTGTNVMYSAGYVLFSGSGDLLAQKFDPDRLELSGPVVPLVRHIEYDTFFHNGAFTASDTGILVYAPKGTGVDSELVWMDRNGKELGVLGEPACFMRHAISPDTQSVAVGVKDSIRGERIWIYDVSRGTRVPLSPNTHGHPYTPIWSPDGKWIAYRTTIGKSSAIWVNASDGSGGERQVGSDSSQIVAPRDWSHDGRYLLVDSWPAWAHGSHSTIQAWPVAGVSKPEVTIMDASDGRLSYDGHWLAYYDSNDAQLYVTSLPHPGARIAIAAGGSDPRWRADGQELYYVGKDRALMAAQVRETTEEFRVLSTHPLFRLPLPDNVGFYDVTPDGQRFLINTRTHLERSAPLMVITDWRAQFRAESNRQHPKS
jgi:eukaryotic-like serine/threonine-protein kinase